MKITLLLLIPVLLLLLIFMKVCKQKCIEGIEFEIKNNVKKSLDKKIKDKKSVSKIVDNIQQSYKIVIMLKMYLLISLYIQSPQII